MAPSHCAGSLRKLLVGNDLTSPFADPPTNLNGVQPCDSLPTRANSKYRPATLGFAILPTPPGFWSPERGSANDPDGASQSSYQRSTSPSFSTAGSCTRSRMNADSVSTHVRSISDTPASCHDFSYRYTVRPNAAGNSRNPLTGNPSRTYGPELVSSSGSWLRTPGNTHGDSDHARVDRPRVAGAD